MHYEPSQLQLDAEHLARTGARAVKESLARPGTTDARTKSTKTDYVTACDTTSEAAIRQAVGELWGSTGYSITGEESGPEPVRPGEPRLIVDPVDGTANLFAGIPDYGVSVAIEVDGVVLAGAVVEPVSGREYSAGRGNGARVYDPNVVHQWRPLNASVGRPLSQRLMATGFSYEAHERVEQARVVSRMIGQVEDLRRGGSAVIDQVRVAQGLIGFYFEHHLNLWDYAAALLIAEEAGAVVSWPGTGGVAAHLGDPIFAAAPEIAAEALQLMADAGAAGLVRNSEAASPEWVVGHAS